MILKKLYQNLCNNSLTCNEVVSKLKVLARTYSYSDLADDIDELLTKDTDQPDEDELIGFFNYELNN